MTHHYNGYLVKGHREPSGGWKDLDLDLDRGGGHLGACMCKNIPCGIYAGARGAPRSLSEVHTITLHGSRAVAVNENGG